MESSPDAIISIDAGGKVTEWNPAAEQIFGYTRALAIGQEVVALIVPESYEESGHAILAQTLKSGKGRLFRKRTELTAVRANGGKFPIELTLTCAQERGPPAFIARICDITERKLAESILRKSEERFRLLVEGVGEYAIHLLDPNGRVLTWNTGVEHIDGYRARDIIGRRFHRFYTPEDIARCKPEQALGTAGAEGRSVDEGWSVRKNGSRYWASVVLTALRHKNGELFGFSRIGCDHTKRKEAEGEAARLTAELEARLRERTAELQAAMQLLQKA